MPKNLTLKFLVIIDILTLTKEGLSNNRIAQELGISDTTVKKYQDRYGINKKTRDDVAESIINQLHKDQKEYCVDYEKQTICIPKLYNLTCFNCRFVSGKKKEILEHLDKCEDKEEKLITEQTI